MTTITRRRLFGLVGAAVALAAVPAGAALASGSVVNAPALRLVGESGPETIVPSHAYMVGNSAGTATWRKLPPAELGEPITTNFANASIHANVDAICTEVTKGGEIHVTITADTSLLRAELAALEDRARRVSMLDDARWDVHHAWRA